MQTKGKLLKFELIVIFLLFLFSRLPLLGYDTFNTDSWKWKSRSYNFGGAVFSGDFASTIQKYHPGVTLMWLGTFTIKSYNAYYDIVFHHPPIDNDIKTVFEFNFVFKLFIVTVIGLTLTSVYFVLFTLFGRKYAFIALLLISLEPFYAGLTREVHLEGLMSAFMIASFVWLFYYLETRRAFLLFISAFFAALAVLTKTTSVFLIPFTGLTLFTFFFMQKRNIMFAVRGALAPFFKWLGIVVVLFIVFWPAMWVVPLKAVNEMYRGINEVGIEEGHDQLYFGQFMNDPGIGFYPVVLFIKSSLYLILGVVGYMFVARKAFDKRTERFVLFALLFAIFYFIELSIPSKKIDRYLVPSMLALLLVGGFFYEWLLSRVKNFTNIFFILLFSPAVLLFIALTPDYFSYYSPLVGGLGKGMFILEPKWMIGSTEIENYFKKDLVVQNYEPFLASESIDDYITQKALLKNKLVAGFPQKYFTQIYPFISATGGRAVIQDIYGFGVVAKYFVYPVWADTSSLETEFTLKYKDSIYKDGVEIYRIYWSTRKI